jgi:ABC-type multidrug transport system ATPase subunit
MIEFVGLSGREKDKVGHFSHGMKQRLGIAQTILHDPDLIVLDEPNTGLDPQGSIDIRNLLLQIRNERNKTILLSSHILSEIELVANRMVIIARGKSIVQGNVTELLNQQDLVVSFEVDNVEEARNIIRESVLCGSIEKIDNNKLQLSIGYNLIPQANQLFTEGGIKVYGIDAKRKLEDYFIKLVNT